MKGPGVDISIPPPIHRPLTITMYREKTECTRPSNLGFVTCIAAALNAQVHRAESTSRSQTLMQDTPAVVKCSTISVCILKYSEMPFGGTRSVQSSGNKKTQSSKSTFDIAKPFSHLNTREEDSEMQMHDYM